MPKGRKGSLLVLQSGGPTHVINQSLAGVFYEAERSGAFERVYGADHGPRGLIAGNFIDLSAQTKAVWRAVARTPGSALGTARRKITGEDIPAVFEVLQSHNVTCIINIGGNDSAENARLFGEAARQRDYPLTVIGVPKTVDNDLPETDHCPGFGSAARYLALATMSTARTPRPWASTARSWSWKRWGVTRRGSPSRRAWPSGRSATRRTRSSAREGRPRGPLLALLDEAMTKFGYAVAVVAENAKGPDGRWAPEASRLRRRVRSRLLAEPGALSLPLGEPAVEGARNFTKPGCWRGRWPSPSPGSTPRRRAWSARRRCATRCRARPARW